jgi:hypothetical protein
MRCQTGGTISTSRCWIGLCFILIIMALTIGKECRSLPGDA